MLDAVTAVKALAGSYRAVKAVGAVNLVPFHLGCVGKYCDGADGGC